MGRSQERQWALQPTQPVRSLGSQQPHTVHPHHPEFTAPNPSCTPKPLSPQLTYTLPSVYGAPSFPQPCSKPHPPPSLQGSGVFGNTKTIEGASCRILWAQGQCTGWGPLCVCKQESVPASTEGLREMGWPLGSFATFNSGPAGSERGRAGTLHPPSPKFLALGTHRFSC